MQATAIFNKNGQADIPLNRLHKEWTRVALICRCLGLMRKGEKPDNGLKSQLAGMQQEVTGFRSNGRWKNFAVDYNLNSIDIDIAVFTAAPDFDPKIGWMYQSLQPGMNSMFPSAALIGELLFLETDETPQIHHCLHPHAPLISQGIISRETNDFYTPLKPTESFLNFLHNGTKGKVLPKIPGAAHINLKGTMDDLIISTHCRQVLKEFTVWVQNRKFVENEWGGIFNGGPVALFSGPSGTGKTFAAAVLANSLDFPLFRVDLGMLVSKYIGETEKNLSSMFDAAGGKNVVLLFDEADSLFGKRGEVRDARDRYANMEVSHLLSRMENHNGPCILTTNLRRHLDPAFARRFHMCAEFPRPDAASRVLLWKKSLPPKAPLADEVNIEKLGAALSLTGAQIKNIALHSACNAAGDRKKIENRHLARSAYVELLKEGTEVIPSSLGFLWEYLP